MSNKNIKMNNNKVKLEWRSWFLYIVLAMLILLFSILNKNFFSISNFGNIGRQASMISIIGFGLTFVITTAQIDLSVGAIVGLVGMVSSLGLQWGFGPIGASFLGILVGLTIGLLNGVIVAKAKIPSFLVTLGSLSIARGIALTITDTQTVVVYDQTFKNLWGSGDIFKVPYSLLWVFIFLGIGTFIYNYTIFGNHVKATGGNFKAAEFSGVNTSLVIIRVFLISGFCAALAGLIMTSRLGAGRPEVGAGLELDAIAAVILGGTSLFGGKGSVQRTLVGALIMTVLINGLIILGVSHSIQKIIMGVIIITAVSLSEKR